MVFNVFSVGPNRFQEVSKKLQDASIRLQDAPRRLQDAPRCFQAASKTPPRAAKALRWLQDAPRRFRTPPKRSKTPLRRFQDAQGSKTAANIKGLSSRAGVLLPLSSSSGSAAYRGKHPATFKSTLGVLYISYKCMRAVGARIDQDNEWPEAR